MFAFLGGQGFPIGVVKEACANVKSPEKGAEREFFYPILNEHFHPVLAEKIVPRILKLLKTKGLFIGGWPGVGKTQFAKMLAMLLGRFWIDERELEQAPD